MSLNPYTIVIVALFFALFGAPAALSEGGASQDLSAREVLEADQIAEQLVEALD